jgi:hypothetical protein
MLHRVALVGTDVPPKRRFLQEPHDVTSQKAAFFIFQYLHVIFEILMIVHSDISKRTHEFYIYI